MEELDVYFLLFDLSFGHDLDSEYFAWGSMGAVSHHAKCSFADLISEWISFLDVFAPHELEFFEVIDVESSFLLKGKLLRGLSLKSSSDIDLILGLMLWLLERLWLSRVIISLVSFSLLSDVYRSGVTHSLRNLVVWLPWASWRIQTPIRWGLWRKSMPSFEALSALKSRSTSQWRRH